MPSSSLYDPPTWGTAQVAHYVGRQRTWTNTVNYPNVPRSELPQNLYDDLQDDLSQVRFSGAYDASVATGATVTVIPPGYLRTGTELQQYVDRLFSDSGFVAIANRVSDENILKLLSKVADQKTNVAVMAAEAHKTTDLILSSATRVTTAYRQFVRGNFKGVAKTLGIDKKSRHKTWLEYKYGWMPMLLDAKGAAEVFAESLHGPARPPRFSVSSTSSAPISYRRSVAYNAYGGGTSTYVESLIGTYRCRHKLILEVVNPEFVRLQQMGLTNPLEVAWELIPFSFVADWFISVGDWLRGLTALHGLRIVSGFRSNVNEIATRYEQPETIRFSGGHMYTNGDRSHHEYRRHYRRDAFSLTEPASLPKLKNPLTSLDRLVTGLALTKSQFRGDFASNRARLRV